MNAGLVIILQAAAFVPFGAPEPKTDPSYWLTIDDLGSYAAYRSSIDPVGVELHTDEVGRAVKCRIFRTSGFADLDRSVCERTLGRARFDPATGPTEHKVPSVWRSVYYWSAADAERAHKHGPFDVRIATDIDRNPDLIGTAQVLLSVTERAEIEKCSVRYATGSKAVFAAACDSIGRHIENVAILDENGEPVRGFRIARIEYFAP